jgi:O-antigen/teichoic acid export membrane protein
MAPPLYKAEFAPAALVLRTMSATFVLTYLNVISANCLAALDRGWTVTITSVATLLLTPVLNFILIPLGLKHFGPSGGAAACAASIVIAEGLTTTVMIQRLGPRALDRRLLSCLARTLITGVTVVAFDFVLSTQGMLPWLRVGVDAAVYVGLALLTGSVRVSEAVAFVKLAKSQRRAGATA